MFRAPKVPELRVRETEKSTLESETKILDHYSMQTYPQLVGNMASGATFGQVMNICPECMLLVSSGMIWDDLGTFWSDFKVQNNIYKNSVELSLQNQIRFNKDDN